MMVSIVINTAAMSSQTNLNKASVESQASISRLSSGNKISRAADDVAGLAVGTILKSNVSTLKAALTNSSQASSLLGVTDGALSNIGDMLQRQKVLASQATSGSLTNQARNFLNQEFQNLTAQINQVAAATNFNGIKLIDGSLFAPSALTTNNVHGTRGSATLDMTGTGDFTAGDTLIIAGGTFTFVANGTAPGLDEVEVGASRAATMQNIVTKINNITNVSASTHQAAFAKMTASSNGNVLTLTSKSEGNAAGNLAVSTGGSAQPGLNGAPSGAGSITGNLIGGTDGTTGMQSGKTSVSGTLGDAIVTTLNTAALVGITGNSAFVGTIKDFTTSYVSANKVNVALKVGDYTYKTTINDTNTASTYRFSSSEAGGGYFDVALAATTVTSQAGADTLARRMSQAFATLSFTQQQDVSSYKPGGTVFNGTTSLGTMAGSTMVLKSNNFTNLNVESINVEEHTQGATTTKIEMVIGGETFRNTAVSTTMGTFTLTSTKDSNNTLTYTPGSGTINLTAVGSAASVQSAFETAFGLKNGGSGLSFQTGTNTSDNIAVQVKSAKTQDIYLDSTGITQALDIGTANGAVTAGTVLDHAINAVAAIRANVGALQSRFDYAAANISTAIQNQDAARGNFLDTDVAAESTAFAASQVKIQASISVLAQANQMPQNLLKLIG
jgi:flagellin